MYESVCDVKNYSCCILLVFCQSSPSHPLSDVDLEIRVFCVFCVFLCLFIVVRYCRWVTFCVFGVFSRLFRVVTTSASDCVERLVSKMTCYVSSGTLNSTHSLTG